MTVYNPEDFPLKGSLLLEASAGTGKTYALERMVSRLLVQGESPLKIEEILVVTFTERAAVEMRERIRMLLEANAADESFPPTEKRRYRRALLDFDMAPIHTIHGFCRYVLRTWPLESGSPFEQTLDPINSPEIEVLRDYLATLDLKGWEKESLRAFRNSCKNVEEMIQILVGDLNDESIAPGAIIQPNEEELSWVKDLVEEFNGGKGDLLRARDAWLGSPWTDKEINQALIDAEMSKRGKTSAVLEKIHLHREVCLRAESFQELMDALWGDPAGLGLNRHFSSLLNVARSEAEGDWVRNLREFLKALGPLVDWGDIEHRIDEQVQALAFRLRAVKELSRKVEQRKDESGVWSFTDLVRRVAEICTGEKARPALVSILQRRFKAALIDEFQDTDPRQWEIFRRLFADKDHLLVLIGDPKQSIYGFRGTDLQAYHRASRTVSLERRYRLGTNYRSSAALVQAVNQLFGAVFSESGGGEDSMNFKPVHAGARDLPLLISPQKGSPITFVALEGEKLPDIRRSWSEGIVAEILYLLNPAHENFWLFPDGKKRPISASDIAVLCERGQEETEVLELLQSFGVAALRYRNLSVFSSPVLPFFRTYLKILASPRSPGNWRSLLLGPFFRISPPVLEALEKMGHLDELAEFGALWRRSLEEGNLILGVEKLFAMAPVLSLWAREAGAEPDECHRIAQAWPIRILAENGGERLWTDYHHLLELLQERQMTGQNSPRALLLWMREQEESASGEANNALRLEREDAAVKVMTMHAAKGLQFPLVFIHGGLRTHLGSKKTGEPWHFVEGESLVVDYLCRRNNEESHRAYAWEEQKRLWYVAFTRAIERVWIPRPLGKQFLAVESLFAAFDPERSLGSGSLQHYYTRKEEALEAKKFLSTFLEHVISAHPDYFTLARSRPPQAPLSALRDDSPLILAPLPADDLAERGFHTSSYSSLAGHLFKISEPEEGRDVDSHLSESFLPGSVEGEEILLAQDRGTLFGTLIHALFEEIDYVLVRNLSLEEFQADLSVEKFFETISQKHFPLAWYLTRKNELKTLIWQTLRAPVLEGLRLCELEAHKRRVETEFLLFIPRAATIIETGSSFRLRKGFLKGFIDLFFQHEGRWWVADWKTNVPTVFLDEEVYEIPMLKQMMQEHHYDLQYRIYLLALVCQLAKLRGTPVDWDREIGGVLYCFVRGTRERDQRGIYSIHPDSSEMRPWFEALGYSEFLL